MDKLFLHIFIFLFSINYAQAQRNDKNLVVTTLTDTSSINDLLKQAKEFLYRQDADSINCKPLLEAALDKSKSIDYKEGICYSLIGLASVAIYYGDHGKAFQKLNEAEKYNQVESPKYGDYKSLIASNKAYVYNKLGLFDSAISYHLKVINIREKYELKIHSYSYNNLGSTFHKINNLEKAQYYLKLAQELAIEEKDSVVLSSVFMNMANVYRTQHFQGQYLDEFLKLNLQALEIAKANNNYNLQATILINLASSYISIKIPDYSQALSYLNEAALLPQMNVSQQMIMQINFAAIKYGENRFIEGDSILNNVLENALETASLGLLTNVYRSFYFSHKKRGDYKNALYYLELNNKAKDSLQGENVTLNVNQLQIQYETAQKDNELLENKLLITQQGASLQKRNSIIISLAGASFTLIGFVFLYFRNKKKSDIQKQEIAAWRATLDGEENERKRMAKDLHDNIGGTLSTVKMWFSTIAEREGSLHQDREFQDALKLLDQTLIEVRNTAHHLMPELLLRYGLPKAVEIFCGNVEKAAKLQIDFKYLGYIGNIEKSIELILYRCIQELIHNIVKHSKATHVLVQLSKHDKVLSLTVEDNGIGMNIEELAENDGIGLRNIKNNIKNSGGQFQIQSKIGSGTIIDIDIEIKEEYPDGFDKIKETTKDKIFESIKSA